MNFGDPFGLTDYNQQQTIEQFLQQAYSDATAGYFKGLRNIFHHSSGGADFDFAHNEHAGDTFTVCGIKMSAGDFGNFMAGFQSGAWDDAFYGDVDMGFSLKHLWQLRYAETVARMFGAGYHLKGDTDVPNDRLDKGGMPWITLGADYGRSFSQRGGGCGCLK